MSEHLGNSIATRTERTVASESSRRLEYWPRTAGGRWAWTFLSLRHAFASWALNQPGLRIEDVSRLLGHSSVRVTQDVYIHVHDDLYGRFYRATE